VAVLSKAQGLFLFAKLAMDAALESTNDVQAAIDRLPDNLHLMYTRLLADHTSKHNIERGQQLLLMQWITHSVRPLRFIEMADVLFSSREIEAERASFALHADHYWSCHATRHCVSYITLSQTS
jgi:hypothetical protein